MNLNNLTVTFRGKIILLLSTFFFKYNKSLNGCILLFAFTFKNTDFKVHFSYFARDLRCECRNSIKGDEELQLFEHEGPFF